MEKYSKRISFILFICFHVLRASLVLRLHARTSEMNYVGMEFERFNDGELSTRASLMPAAFSVTQVDLRHMDEKSGSNVVDVGVDLSEFYMSVEWDILEVPAVR